MNSVFVELLVKSFVACLLLSGGTTSHPDLVIFSLDAQQKKCGSNVSAIGAAVPELDESCCCQEQTQPRV